MKRLVVLMLSMTLLITACTVNPGTSPGPGSPSFSSSPVTTTQPSAMAMTVGKTSDNISRERAIEIASAKMQPEVVKRAAISAELRGGSWEVTFDDLNAAADELKPFPFWHDGPPDADGNPPTDPYPGIWQIVIVEVDSTTGELRGLRALHEAKPGPYMSEAEAIEHARKAARTMDFADWESDATVQSYLEGDMWTVIFWDEGNPERRITITIDAADGDPVVIKRG